MGDSAMDTDSDSDPVVQANRPPAQAEGKRFAAAADAVVCDRPLAATEESDQLACTWNKQRAERVTRSCAISAPPLTPVEVCPQQVSKATEMAVFLDRIEHIEIRDVIEREENVVFYVLDVYHFQEQKGIPKTSASTSSSGSSSADRMHNGKRSCDGRRPDYQLEHRYSSFARLRSRVWDAARRRHGRKPSLFKTNASSCAFCHKLVALLESSRQQPCLRVKFKTTTEARKGILSAFINDLVRTVRENNTQCARSLRGYHEIPAHVKRFLTPPTGANFFE